MSTSLPFGIPSHWKFYSDHALPGFVGLIRTDGKVVPFYRLLPGHANIIHVSTGDYAHEADGDDPLPTLENP